MDHGTTVTDEQLSWGEICARYPAQWVVLVDMDWEPGSNLEFRTARVLARGAGRRDPLAQVRATGAMPRSTAHLFTGPKEVTTAAVP